MPNCASSTPAIAGPATDPTWNSSCHNATADAYESGSTMLAIVAERAEESTAENIADIAVNTYSGHSAEWPPIELTASPTLVRDITAPVINRSRRLSIASAIEPPTSEPNRSGPSCANPSSPTSSDE